MPPARRPAARPDARSRGHQGQALVEYLLVIGVVALLCIPALSFLQSATTRAYDAQREALSDPPLGAAPTRTPGPAYTYPASEEQCKNGLWRTYVTTAGTFKNQGDCQSWVATHGRNAPALTPVPTATPPLYTPPTATPTTVPEPTAAAHTTPTNRGQCNNGKWRDYHPPSGPFASEQECEDWVDDH